MASPLRQLLALLTENITALETACADSDTSIPDLHQPFSPASEAFRANPAAAGAASIISAAALQINAIVMPPQLSLYGAVGGHFKSAATRVCVESNVTEILREAGPEGLHVEEIARVNGQDPQKLGRFIRYLATNHIYRELKPNVFTNTRISSMMDTLKSSKEIVANPEQKHDNTVGVAALVSHHLDECFKASAYAWETLADPQTAFSGDPTASAFARSIGTKDTLWQYYGRPEERFRHRRFDIAMQGVQALQPPDVILRACDWKSLPAGSVVIDVGGGLGTSSVMLAKNFPDLNIVVQDLPAVIEDAKKFWATTMPGSLKSGKVKLEAHNFFEPQPQKNASVFFLKHIMHDWSDQYCVKILKQLRAAATPQTKLVLMDSIMPFACHDASGEDEGNDISGAAPREAPAPLLANFGAVNEMVYMVDVLMFLIFNSQERTIRHTINLLRSTGWKVTVVHRQDGDSTFLQPIEAIPF